MKKLLFLPILYFIFSIFSMSAQAGIVTMNMEDEDIKEKLEAYKDHAKDNLNVCNVASATGGGSVTGDAGDAIKLYSSSAGANSPWGNNITGSSGDAFNNIASCVANGKFASASFDGPYELSSPSANAGKVDCAGYANSCTISLILAGDATFYTATVKEQTCTSIKVKSDTVKGGGTVSWSGWNSPFLYSQNSSYQNLQITINSAFNNYQNQAPAFNNNNGWQVTAENNHFIVNNKPQNHLFYELAMNKVILNRNGQNFTSKQDLTNYLQTSDFFNNLGLNETQKDNSLSYILPILPDTKNYYLTILSSKSIEDISNLDISPSVKTARIYYAIYPTNTTVKTNGDLIFPQINQITEANLLEAGEILVKPEMFVLWE